MSRYERVSKTWKTLIDTRNKSAQRARDNPKKIKANTLAKSISLENKKCVICGSTRFLVRHHEDYDKPLQVTIVCKSCHAYIHERKRSPSHE